MESSRQDDSTGILFKAIRCSMTPVRIFKDRPASCLNDRAQWANTGDLLALLGIGLSFFSVPFCPSLLIHNSRTARDFDFKFTYLASLDFSLSFGTGPLPVRQRHPVPNFRARSSLKPNLGGIYLWTFCVIFLHPTSHSGVLKRRTRRRPFLNENGRTRNYQRYNH